MGKIINGRKYDETTAKLVGSWDNGLYTNDFNYRSEDLYRKKTGEFFLHCWRSQYVPLTYGEAQDWAEKHLDSEEYEKIFGEVYEDKEDAILTARVSPAIKRKVSQLASKNGCSFSEIVSIAINDLTI